MPRRNSFHLPPPWPAEGPVEISGPEAHHLLTVLRTPAGEIVRLFDGLGREGLFHVLDASRKRALLDPLETRHVPPPSPSVTLALGWNKAERRSWILEKAVELGAGEIVFWQAERSQGRIPATPKETWRAKLVAAAKQCEAAWLPEISTRDGIEDLCTFSRRFPARIVLWEDSNAPLLDDATFSGKDSILAIVGPEGGLTEMEVRTLMDAGVVPASLGPTILRWETAALMLLGLAWWRRTTATPHPEGETRP